MRIKTWLGILVVVLVSYGHSALEAQSLQAQPFDFSFTAVEGAGGYLIEVRGPSGKIVVSRTMKADQTDVSLSLVPGPYELRLTTLNRLQHAESATDWTPIHVAAAGPPEVGAMAATTIMTGKAQFIRLSVQGLASDAVAAVKAPSGTSIPATISWSGSTSIEIHLPALSRAGAYKVILTNPPNLSLTLSDKLTVEYPPPVVAHIDPTSFEQGAGTLDLRLSGQDFSPEVVVGLMPVADGARSTTDTSSLIPLEVTKSDALSITARLPPDLGVAAYTVMIANASGAPAASAGRITIVASARGPTMTLVHPYGSVTVQAQVEGRLYLDGKGMGTLRGGATARLDEVETGSHTLFMQYTDGEEEKESVVVNDGQAMAVSFSHTVGSLPMATIDIKGSQDQWKDIHPALIGVSTQKGNLFIDKVFFAVDGQNLYMRFDIKDDAKSSFFHPNNFNTGHNAVSYGVDIRNGDLDIGVELHIEHAAHWMADVVEEFMPIGTGKLIARSDDYVMKGSTVVAAFPLKPIKNYLGPLAAGQCYKLNAYISYCDQSWVNVSHTDRMPFTF